jgi:hypothetical protein
MYICESMIWYKYMVYVSPGAWTHLVDLGVDPIMQLLQGHGVGALKVERLGIVRIIQHFISHIDQHFGSLQA